MLLGIAFILADNFDTTEGFLFGRRSRDVSKFVIAASESKFKA